MSAISSSVNLNYAENNYGRNTQPRFYQPSGPLLGNNILTPGIGFQRSIPGAPCVRTQPAAYPLNQWAFDKVNQRRLNIDGFPVRDNLCAYGCSNTGNDMIVPVPFRPAFNYTLPGAVPSAVRLFRNCGV